ncbi:MAG: sigma 54-interacting transcriptional regulator [Desulfuromonadales bacterium]|nr:sigma 54-interacting transcriptional regulator [Desulfuromonadales bacterium]
MSKIACILPDGRLLEGARNVYRDCFSEIRIEKGLLQEAVEVAMALAREDYEVFISRGRTAAIIREAGLEASVVEIPITAIDVIQTIERAKFQGKHIGVVAFAPMIPGIDYLGTILGGGIRFYPLEHESKVEELVIRAIGDKADVIVGGAITGKVAKKHGLPFALIENSPESMLQAAQEARNIAFARKQEKARGNLFKAVLDYAYDGIISINREGKVTSFNPVAERMLHISEANALGRPIRHIWPEIELEAVLDNAQEDLGQLAKINDHYLVCNKAPICVNGNVVGAVATFQEASHIQQMEAKVRRRLFASGHRATFCFDDIVGTSAILKKHMALARDFAKTDSSILIQGETGTGKEVFAQSIHNFSSRQQGPFVALNCAALPAHILESELFGYVSGAFTGASSKGKPGLFEIAHGGTLFLDEIAEMEYATQGKLLRVLQEKKVMRLGSDKVTPVNVRIIAATNQNLKSLVNDNKFRADLYYRLNVLQLRLFPLRERKEDILALSQFFLDKHSLASGRKLTLTPRALQALTEYGWAGNVRELQNILERILATLKQAKIDADIVGQHLEDHHEPEIRAQILQDEWEEIRRALAEARGKHAEAAKILGISRSTLWRKLKKMP